MADANTIVREIEAAYRHYIDVFNREDAAGFVGCYTHPYHGEWRTGIVDRQYRSGPRTRVSRDHEALHKQEWGAAVSTACDLGTVF
jgi:hypothetical protein